MKKAINKKLRVKLIWAFLISLTAFLILIFIAPLPQEGDWSYSPVILDENDEYLRVYLDSNEQWHLQHQGEIPDKLRIAVLEFEDKNFYSHFGVDPLAITRALFANLKEGAIVSGGSTITMQVARLYLNKERRLIYKIREAFISLKLEVFMSKDEILLTYLNNAPYGRNIVGIKSAAYKYYGKELEELTWAEAALFAVLPNNPGYLYPGYNTDKLRAKRDFLLHKLVLQGWIDEQQYENSVREAIPTNIHSFPIIAPHLGDRLKNTANSINKTTINRNLQIKLEELAAKEGAYLSSLGIKNLAILVSNTKSHEVKAYIGSQDYFSNSTNGFVDGVQALRSSGSILKPFIYGYALEKGMLTTQSLLEDINKNYGILLPKNYDNQYRGLSTLTQALQKSLNIPAYEVTKMLGIYDAVSVLKSVGMKSLYREPSSYGLSICIGGAEVNLWDLSEMYQTLANDGIYESLKVTNDEEVSSHQSLLSPAASFLTLEILQGVKKPARYINNFPNFAWKTGTSNGFRDAWAVGVDQEWTIAVWAGNFTGQGNPNLTGREIAGSILFKVLSQLTHNSSGFFKKPWDDFKQVAVCAVSGYSPTKNCNDTLWVEVPNNAFILPKCPYHKQLIVDENETMQLCSDCWQGLAKKSISVLDYPPDVDYYLKQNGTVPPPIIPHNPECSLLDTNSHLIIKYPINNSNIYLPKDLNGKLNTFQAQAYSSDAILFWFLDGKLVGKTEDEHQLDLVTTSGKKELLLISSEGASQKVNFEIILKED